MAKKTYDMAKEIAIGNETIICPRDVAEETYDIANKTCDMAKETYDTEKETCICIYFLELRKREIVFCVKPINLSMHLS